MNTSTRPTVGLALSGSGNRSTFYIGFLEVMNEFNIPIDYIAACSGGSLVAAAYAGGMLKEFKDLALHINKKNMRQYITKAKNGGLYSMDPLEQEIQRFTKGLTFEEAQPKMAFVAVDIETGDQIILCMGDIAHAAIVSCTLPGIFEPVKWGGRTLVDGGLINQIPLDVLQNAGIDIMIGVNMRGMKHIFSERQMGFRKFLNVIKKFFFFDEITGWVGSLLKDDADEDYMKAPGIFTVLGKSLDIAIQASQNEVAMPEADLIITPDMDVMKRLDFNESTMKLYYELGRKTAEEYVPQIKTLIEEKEKNQNMAKIVKVN